MSFKAKPWITWSLKCVISAGILYVIFTNIPLSAVGSVVTSAKPALVGLAILLGFVMRYVAAYRMKILTSRQGLSPSTWQIYKINLMTSFYGMFLPGYLAGGAIRWYKLARLDNKPSEALISIVVNRWFQTVTVILLGLGFWSADEHARDHGWIGSTLLGLLGLFLILYVLVFNRTVAAGVSRRVGRLRFLPENLRGWLQQTFEAAGMYGGLQKRVVTKLWLLSFAAESIGICSFLCFAGSRKFIC